VTETLESRGYTVGADLHYVDGNGHHAEEAWGARLPDALRFLLPARAMQHDVLDLAAG
jgi:hypothetical protein